MQKLMFTASAAMALVMGAYTAFGQTTEVVAPGGATVVTTTGTTVVPPGTTAIINTPATAYYTPAGLTTDHPLTLGQLIAYRIKDPAISDFKTALQNATISEQFDPSKGFTVFAPIHYDGKHPVDYYIVNERIGVDVMKGSDKVNQYGLTNLRGDRLRISKVNNSYFIDNMRISNADRGPEGVIYSVGGMNNAAQL